MNDSDSDHGKHGHEPQKRAKNAGTETDNKRSGHRGQTRQSSVVEATHGGGAMGEIRMEFEALRLDVEGLLDVLKVCA